MAGKKNRTWYTFDVNFAFDEEKEAFTVKLKKCKRLLIPASAPELDKLKFFSKVLDGIVDEDLSVIIGPFVKIRLSDCVIIGLAFGHSSLWPNVFLPGVCIGRGCQDEESVFLLERMCLEDLVSELATPCSYGSGRAWQLHSTVQISRHYTVFSV